MSYQDFKRVLGESNLERKCLLWFGTALGVLLFLSFFFYGRSIEGLASESYQKLGPELVRAAWLESHFNIDLEQKATYEPATTTQPAGGDAAKATDFNEWMIESGKSIGKEFKWYAVLPFDASTTTLPSHPSIGASDDPGYVYYFPTEERLPLFNSEKSYIADTLKNRPRTELAEVEQTRRGFQKGFRVSIDGKQKYRYYSPLYADSSCVLCHIQSIGNLGALPRPRLAEGDLMAIYCVQVDQDEAAHALAVVTASMWVVAVVIGFISMFLLYFIIRYVIVKPVQHLRDVANAVREGDVEQRAEIQTGDEFEELAASFNRMLRRLLRQQDALQEVNEELDAKIDQIAQANMRLFEMNRMKSDFLATMSHELRTPLNSILGFSDVLAGVDGLDDKQKRYVGNIQRSGRMLLEMINDILDLAKMESGKMEIRATEFRIDAVANAQCDMARPLTERKNIDLECEFEPNLPIMRQDQGKVQQILNNLLSNAIKFTPEGGRIIVRAAPVDDHLMRLTVEDTGVGISEADQAIVFEKFRQGGSAQPQGNAMTREHSGTGLGLSIVRELCRLLGGEVSLSSVLGKGSTFTVLLPWTVSINQNMEAQMQQEVAELTRASLAGLDS